MYFISTTVSSLIVMVSALLAMAFLTLLERKLLAYIQRRKGPNKVMLAGIPQPIADAMKLFFKERIVPLKANPVTYVVAPTLALCISLMIWSIYPNQYNTLISPFTVILFLCLSSMNVYPTLMAGWTSNSKYALLGSLRSVAQTISYEVSMTLILLSVLIISQTFNFTDMTTSSLTWPMILIPPVFLMWMTSILAETNRAPFDFAEGESELVSGFNTEYGSGTFALIFMAEYASIMIMSLLTTLIFMPHLGMSIMTSALTLAIATMFVVIRGTLPRIRYDQLMGLTWKFFLPMVLALMILLMPTLFIFSW